MDGWQRIRGEEPAHPPLLTLVMSADDAKRLHHLFRAKMPILVGDGIAAIRWSNRPRTPLRATFSPRSTRSRRWSNT